ncbi:MAG: methyltransferase domain-containing protein [Burkholderiales bacterium]
MTAPSDTAAIASCVVCGGRDLRDVDVLSPALIGEWGLAPDEVAYVNRQQGRHCAACRSTLRCMALAAALLRRCGASGTFDEFVESPSARKLRVLEINEAGGVSAYLARLPGRVFAEYPRVDMQALPYADASFDLVVHSDTLEHVPDPLRGLRECARVLRDGGACIFTVPMIVGRLTRSRAGLPGSYHGTPADGDGYLVQTEFGADAWRWPLMAGFSDCSVVAVEPPAAHAWIATR